jgi:hypothetical protein
MLQNIQRHERFEYVFACAVYFCVCGRTWFIVQRCLLWLVGGCAFCDWMF